jgi:ATP-binding cassette subfamily B protein
MVETSLWGSTKAHATAAPYRTLFVTYLKPQWVKVLLLLFLLFGNIGLQLLIPQVIRYFIDAAQSQGTQQSLLLAALVFFVLVLGQQALAIVSAYISQNMAWCTTNSLRTDLFRHVLHLDMGFHNNHTPGELLERIDGDTTQLANFLSQLVLQIVAGGLLIAGALFLLAREDWRIGMAMLFFVGLYLVVHIWGQGLAVPRWREARQQAANLSGFVEDHLSGRQEIHTAGAVDVVMVRLYDLLRRELWAKVKADVTTDVGWTLSKLFFAIGYTGAMALGAYLFYRGAVTLGVVYLVIHYLGIVRRPLDSVAREVEDLQRARASLERITLLREIQQEIPAGTETSLPPGALAVTFERVFFGYNGEQTVLHDISFSLAPGEVLGLLGRTGSGKSTLSRLLFRFYDVADGAIMLDGIDIRRLQLAHLRQRVGLVTQDVQIFHASVRDNLTLFAETIEDKAVWDALRALELDKWVAAMPHGLKTVLGANGYGLSAGEAQLLALARVFLKDPGVVILDEASSRLDPATEQLLERAIDHLLQGRTAIIIAHRMATVRRAEQILILREGRTVEQGRYTSLIQRPDSLLAGLTQQGQPGQQEVLA